MNTNQIALFDITDAPDPRAIHGEIDLHSYDTYILGFSGGKDSIAAFLDLIDQGVPREKIELWHHCVDGENTESGLFDWRVTEDYCRAFARAFGVKLYFSWKNGGLEAEMNRNNQPTLPTSFETPDGVKTAGGKSGKLGTRRMFPQMAADLRIRWCSSYGKVDVGAKAITGQSRFNNSRTLFVTGERAEESSARAHYLTFEPHRTDCRNGRLARHVDQLRAVHAWSESEVWEKIAQHGVKPHPAYLLGWGRLSCMCCIFGSDRQWASIRQIDPERFAQIAQYEREFGKTIHRTLTVEQRADSAEPYESITPELVAQAKSTHYTQSILMNPDEWELPPGAFGEKAGPT